MTHNMIRTGRGEIGDELFRTYYGFAVTSKSIDVLGLHCMISHWVNLNVSLDRMKHNQCILIGYSFSGRILI